MLRVLVSLVTFGSLACTSSSSSPDNVDAGVFDGGADTACGPLTACAVGDFFATCGAASGTPVLACDSTQCRWFTNGCVADGFVASDCPASDICCHDEWPFPHGGEQPGLYSRLYGLGRSPWDATREMNVDVVIDASLTGDTTSFACSGDVGLGQNNPCNGFAGQPQARRSGSLVISSPNTGVEGWFPWIEVVESGAGLYRSRICAFAFTDTVSMTCPTRPVPVCARTGTLRLSKWPEDSSRIAGLVADFAVKFPLGATLDGTVVVP